MGYMALKQTRIFQIWKKDKRERGGVERKERNPKEDMFIISKAKSH